MSTNVRTIADCPSYQITRSGNTCRIGEMAFLRPAQGKRGYWTVSLWEFGKGKTYYVHQLVAKAFLPPKPTPKHEVAHFDGDKSHNHDSNLRWATRKENEEDKIRHGRTNRGQRNGMAKLSDADVADIRSSVEEGMSQKTVATLHHISPSAVWNIVHFRNRK